MRLLAQAVCLTAIVVATTAGCHGSTTPTRAQNQAQVFPLTITRAGGVAGFRDVLVVNRDGLVSVTRAGQKPRQCQLTAGVTQQLTAAMSSVVWPSATPTSTHPAFPDEMVTTMASPGVSPLRAQDPQAGPAGRLVLELLNDINDGPAGSLLCRPL
jgi:hypothetical protein